MADDINSLRGEIKDVTTGLSEVKVDVSAIKVSMAETNRHLDRIDHTLKQVQMIGQTVVLLDRDIKAVSKRTDELENEKADKVETIHEMSRIADRVTALEDHKKKFAERLAKWVTPFILAILMAVGGYIVTKLGFTEFLGGGR